MTVLNAWLLATVSSNWGLCSLAIAAFFDALIIPIPTEALVLATASAFRASGQPLPALVVIVCAFSFMAGDAATYYLGSLVPLEKIIFFRGSVGKAVLIWADRAFERGGGFFTIASRFVPSGRTVINLMAGASRYSLARYMILAWIAGLLWAVYMWFVGYLAAAWIHNNPIAVVVLGCVIGMLIGCLWDVLMKIIAKYTK